LEQVIRATSDLAQLDHWLDAACECFHFGAISPPGRPGATKWRPARQKQNTTFPWPAKTLIEACPSERAALYDLVGLPIPSADQIARDAAYKFALRKILINLFAK
jgi:hypothetical protein